MVKIVKVNRKSSILTPSSLACLSNIPTINLTSGCAHGCLYCYTRGYSTFPGENIIILYANSLAKLQSELKHKRKKPYAVYFSPASDIFQPVPEVLEMGYDVLAYLFENEIRVAFLTKGHIPDPHMQLILANSRLVRAQFGLITIDVKITKTLEPGAAIPESRLFQAKQFIEAGIETQIRVDPIIPGLTDDNDSLSKLCAAVADIRVKRIAASVLFLRTAIYKSLKCHCDPHIFKSLIAKFGKARKIKIHAENSSVTALPAQMRLDIYKRLERIAFEHGIAVRLCACKNPEIASGTCSIAGEWSGPSQRDLFYEE